MNKTHLIVFLVGTILGLVAGFFSGKAIYDKPLVESVTRDTLVVFDTIPQYYPKPVEVERVRTEYQWLPIAKITHDTVGFTQFVHDSVLVEVPITSKHYHGENYDAYVSGYRPNLDSIEVYQKEKIITETITVTQKAKTKTKHWGIGFTGGYGYDFNSKTAAPFVGVGLSYNIFSF